MGVGYPEDLVVSIALGADMFDCVWPTRTAVSSETSERLNLLVSVLMRTQRFGNAIVPTGMINIRNAKYADDFGPVDDTCKCKICRPRSEDGLGVTRAFIHHLASKETVGAHLLSIHNIHYQLNLMGEARQAIIEDRYPAYVKDFFAKLYEGRENPQWAVDALTRVGIDL
jgi:tRNA-guanine family transglycosylase